MNILITGGTGFVGSALTAALAAAGHSGWVISRGGAASSNRLPEEGRAAFSLVSWEALEAAPQQVKNVGAVVNLAGETINQRWTAAAKEKIRDSRVETADRLSHLLESADALPEVLIQASGVNAYGFSRSAAFTEESATGEGDFLSSVVRDWEAAAASIPARRRAVLRFGIVLDRDGGALPLMLLPFRVFAGGPLGSGEQWMSWIHRRDLVRLILFALENEAMSGVINATAPQPVQNRDFAKAAAAVLHSSAWLRAPGGPLKLALGEMSALLLEGQRVLPAKALEAGFRFLYPDIRSALEAK
ncbi:TIGR01777 family oxidoreductase [Paenibacillus sp. YN15]|uniref:TIGR01777 family oxidoreductase n=1 Tax=Paenibacillus sp. YN15 TaxID=1742774 RepID=UPI000DCC0A1F|nr:TIGR01777 family oxidoreductase [Paenibacillus sp. YN15]RAU92602.1 TIGR01777 family protein [Paenibacillus sp. YN15]